MKSFLLIVKYAPPNPKEDIVKAVKDNIKKVLPDIDDETITKLENRLLNDGKISAALKRARLNIG